MRRVDRGVARRSTPSAFQKPSCSTWAASSGTRGARPCCGTSLRTGGRSPADFSGDGRSGDHADSRAPADPSARVCSGCVRDALLAHARALVVPSPYESLSMVLLEAWNRGTAALVNGRCRVLKGQVERADGGLHYGTAREFAEAVELLVREPPWPARWGHRGGITWTGSTAGRSSCSGSSRCSPKPDLVRSMPGQGAIAAGQAWSGCLSPCVRSGRNHRLQERVGSHRGGAELADHHAGGVIGEAGRFGRCRAGRKGQAERGNHRVARAGDIGHFARRRGQVAPRTSRPAATCRVRRA